MAFTKGHYQAVAKIIDEEVNQALEDHEDFSVAYGIAARLGDLFEADNPLFDRKMFETACGIPQEEYQPTNGS